MDTYIIALTDEQIKRQEEIKNRLDALEYNSMCYDCQKFKSGCAGCKCKVYDGCIYKIKDTSKPSIYKQIEREVNGYDKKRITN